MGYFTVSPPDGAFGVDVSQGVSICINTTPPSGCNITYQVQWLNYTLYYEIFFAWCDAQPWGDPSDWELWLEDIDWDSFPDCYNDSFWFNFSEPNLITTPTDLCHANYNWSCHIDGDYITEYCDWRINWTLNCSGNISTGACYYYFEPSDCPAISYISPPSPNGTVCPCCVDMCISVNNTEGHPMNITFYRNDSQFTDYYIVNQYTNVTNGTYCFCIDGHINNSIYYPMNFHETYHWYVNITDTVTGEYLVSDIFTFRTYPEEFCPCGPEDFLEWSEDTDTISDESWILPISMMFILLIPLMIRRKK